MKPVSIQNIPVRTVTGKELRRAFFRPNVIVDVDYEYLELLTLFQFLESKRRAQ